MGVPKFFRWMSERYPVCSQLILENRIPEFDNLYLDMNGIIHACSHPNDADISFRLTEDQIFLGIFNYIDHLFAKIKPKKLFFMAVDGVAPRAKMNQQRARRFRSAKDAADAKRKALAKGQELPSEPPFDSNCITPGTDFMARLSEQLKYFVNKKVTEDTAWQGIEIVLSGHEVPGEGEHKIMEYLRLAKSNADYHSNVRHCLYGLDADLIMLGLLSHEPHFALLREEVTFGRAKKKTLASSNPDSQSFYLMHLSLLREYLDLEFSALKTSLKFEYNLEKVIDDFILMSFFVGNDFLPNLPGLHINEGALTLMFNEYKQLMPQLDGYLHDSGHLNLDRCQKLLERIGSHERDWFGEELGDVRWLKSKSGEPAKLKNQDPLFMKNSGTATMFKSQKPLYDKIRHFVKTTTSSSGAKLVFDSSEMPARDRAFILKIAKDLGLENGYIENPTSANSESAPGDQHQKHSKSRGNSAHKHQQIYIRWISENDEDDDEEGSEDEEGLQATLRVLKRYDNAEVLDEAEMAANMEAESKALFEKEFIKWKCDYYKNKLHLDYDNKSEFDKYIFHYVEGLQWVLFYYYEGVASWEWFYPYHYGPKITDITNFSTSHIKFQKGTPFLPFEQLMGVLPAGSKQHIPEAYRDLMTDVGSPIIDFYPTDFECDLNGKKADWEAVVVIPFIDEKRLLSALNARKNRLSEEERRRNSFGESFKFIHDPNNPHLHPSSLPGSFPDLPHCTCKMTQWHLPTMGEKGFVQGLCSGVQIGVNALPGFPSMHTIPHVASLGFHGVNVFNSESPNESMIVTLTKDERSVEQFAAAKLGRSVFFGWPFLTEALVVNVFDELFQYNVRGNFTSARSVADITKTPNTPEQSDRFHISVEKSEAFYSKRYGTLIGPVEVIVTIRPLKGMKLLDDGSLIKDFMEDSFQVDVPLSTLVEDPGYEDERFKEKPPPSVEEEFPLDSKVFFLGNQNFGMPADIAGYNGNLVNIKLLKPAEPELQNELNFTLDIVRNHLRCEQYIPSYILAKQLGISNLTLSKISSSMFVYNKSSDSKVNLGLNLKFDSKQRKVLGYTNKVAAGWQYSQRAKDLLMDYRNSFPQFFDRLDKSAQRDMFQDTDFYSAEAATIKINEMKSFLKKAGVKDFEKVPLESVNITKDCILDIERQIDAVYKDFQQPKFKAIQVKNVPRQAILKPEHSRQRLLDQEFDIGERIVHTFDSGSVPLGAKGTIVGMDGPYLEIVFDRTFMGGNSLDNRCSPYRGMTVHKSTVLNLTRIQPPTTQASSRRLSSKPTISFDRRENQSLAFKKAPVQQNQQETAKIYPDSNRNAATAQNSWKRGAPSQLLSRNGGGGNGNNLNNNKSSSQPDSFKSKKLVSVEKVDPSNNTSNLTFSSSSGLQIQVTKRVSNGQTAAPPRGNVVAPSIPPPPPAAAANQNGDMNQMSTNLKAMLNIGGGGPVATAPPPSLTSSMSPAAAAIPPPQQFQYAGGSGYQQNGYQTQQGWGAPPSHPGGYPHQFYPAPAGYYPPHYYHQQQQQQQPAPVETNVSAQIMQGLVNPYAQMYSPYGGTGAAMPAAMVMPVAPVKNELAQLVENSRPVVNVHDHQNNGYQQQINGHQQQHHHHQNNNRRGGGARGGGAGFKRGGGYGGRGRGGKQQTNE